MIPEEIEQLFHTAFSFPEKPLFGVVSTTSSGKPNCRMMRIFDLVEGAPLLITHTESRKWREFDAGAICIVSDDRLTQVVVRGSFQQATHLAESYWPKVRADVRKIYDPKYLVEQPYATTQDLAIPHTPPQTFGVIRLVPEFWELLILDSDYVSSKRVQFAKAHGWKGMRVNVG